MKGQFSNIVENDFTRIKKDKNLKGFEPRTPRMKENSTTDRKKILGVVPSKDFKGRAVVNYWGLVIVLVSCHVGNCLVNADPLSGVSGATSGSSGGHPPAWTTRTGTSLTEQIMMRHVYEQIRSLKFAYEENINQLMRKVDSIDMKVSRHSCDYNGIESVVRKIDSLDIKVNRLEASNLHRLEELSKTIHTKGIRQELAMDGLVQKVDENHERIKQKLTFAEKRLDTINSKMQVYETSITRLESRLTDIDNEISDMSNTLDDIKSLSTIIDDKHNNTQRTMKEQLQAIKSESAGSRQQLEELSSSVKDIGSRLNDTAQTAMVRDDENVRILSADTDRDLRQQINFESRRIEDKITSMYNNLWSRFMSLETTAKHLLKIGNITRRQLREDFQSLLQSEARFAEPESQENYMNLILDVLKRMLQEHKEQMDSNLQMSLTSQNLFIDSLNKSVHYSNRNEELKDMEITLSSILEKIIYTITNKTSRMDTRLVEVMQMIKEYKTQTMRSLSHLTKIVISLTEKNKEDKERFEKGMLDLTKMNEIIASVLQDLYEKFEIVGNMTPSCEETTKCTELNHTRENDNRELDEPDNSREELEREKVQENKIKIENDDVVKIYSENGSNIEHTNTSYQVLNTTNTTQNNKTTTKKHISIVIPYEAIENEEELKSKLQDFFSQLPVAKTEAVILTNSNKQFPDSVKENNGGNSENIAGMQPNLEQTINNAMNDGISQINDGISQIIQKLSTNYNNFESKNAENSDGSQGSSSDSNLPIESTGDQGVNEEKPQQNEGAKKFYDWDGNEDMVHSSQEETKILPDENEEKSVQNEDRKRFNDWDGNEDMVHSSQDEARILPKENEGKSEQNEDDKKIFYDWGGNEDMARSSQEESKILPNENGEKSLQDDDKKKFYEWDGNEDMIRSKEETKQEEKFMESLDNGNAMEIAGNQGTQEGTIQTSTRKNENLVKFPAVLENSNTNGTNNSSEILSQSPSTGSTTNIDNKNGTNNNISVLQSTKNQQSEFAKLMENDNGTSSTEKISKISEQMKNTTGTSSTENISRISTVSPKTDVSQLSTVLPTPTTKNSSSTISTESPASTIKALLLKISTNQPTIETTTKQSQNNEKPKRRTKQDIRQLFEDLKAKRVQRIQELQNLTQENGMMQKDFEDDLKKEERPLSGEDDTPLARRDTSEHFRPITSSEEIANSAPEFDLLYDEQEMPYSA